jgi:hypothetical protein
LQQLTVARLEQQKERLAQYAAQARFAIAQIVDRALIAQGGPSPSGGSDAIKR